MDFDLSDDQLALRDGARALLDDSAATDRVRRVAETPERWDRDLWDAMVGIFAISRRMQSWTCSGSCGSSLSW